MSGAVAGVAGKTVAAVKGQVGAVRAVVTEQAETHLRNAQEELREEHVEIALYKRIETFATEVGDRDTARLAVSIRRDEERMAKFLDAELIRLVKDVVRAEVPRQLRQKPRARSTSRRSSSSSRSTHDESLGRLAIDRLAAQEHILVAMTRAPTARRRDVLRHSPPRSRTFRGNRRATALLSEG